MEVKQKLILCTVCNGLMLILTLVAIAYFRDRDSKYFRFGPHDDLLLISIKVDTWLKWTLCVTLVGVLKIGDLIVNDIGSPILGFNVYNPDKKVITDFTKNELNLLTNAMWTINSVKAVFTAIVSITQIDIALISVLLSEIAGIVTVRTLLNEKTFEPHVEAEYNQMEQVV